MVIDEFHLGSIAKYDLLKSYSVTTINKKYDLAFFKRMSYDFKIYLFNHALHDGLKYSVYEGSDYYELSLSSISVPQWSKQRLNLHWTLTHIPEDQTMITKEYHLPVDLVITRHTDNAIFEVATEYFNAHKQTVIDGYIKNRSINHDCNELFNFKEYEKGFSFL